VWKSEQKCAEPDRLIECSSRRLRNSRW